LLYDSLFCFLFWEREEIWDILRDTTTTILVCFIFYM